MDVVDERRSLLPEDRYTRNDISPAVTEGSDSITIRRPVQYYSINSVVSDSTEHDDRTRASVSRYKYYSKLAPHSNSSLLMPNHVVPPEYFLVLPIKPEAGEQSSIVTVFSIWNTMMGTSLLSLPWAVGQAGFGTGIFIVLAMGALALYTVYRVMKSPEHVGSPGQAMEFSDVCRHFLGKPGEYLSVAFSLAALLGAAIVYWVLMSNFLFHTVQFIYEKVNNELNTTFPTSLNFSYEDAYCPHPPSPEQTNSSHFSTESFDNLGIFSYYSQITKSDKKVSDPGIADIYTLKTSNSTNSMDATFEKIWSQTLTVPFFLLLILSPLINFKSPTFFTKFNALGTVSVLYILTFVAIKAAHWGIHVEPTRDLHFIEFQWTFPALTGTLSLAYFIHNCILSILKNQKHPENNGRDLFLAYCCVAFTYLYIGVLFYLTFPLPKDCIEDNFLNNFRSSDILAFVARICLLFQMVTVFPLLAYIFRIQLLGAFFGSEYPSLKHVLFVNIGVIIVCLIFAVLLPQIGLIIRFSGALCGLAYIFALPCIIYMLSLRRQGLLNWMTLSCHIFIIILGLANFVAQFVIM